MRVASILPLLLVVFAGCTTASVDLVEPEIRLVQLPGTTFTMRYEGRLSISYAVEVENLSSETIQLTSVQLKTVGDAPYELQKTSIPVRKEIRPGDTETVQFTADAYSYGGRFAPDLPVTIRGIARFDTPVGKFRKVFTQVVNQPDDTVPF